MTTSHGVASFHTRVESWECDFNGHWNTRFYARAFRSAATVCASLAGQPRPSDSASQRHCRFHRELVAGDAVEVRSFAMADGADASGIAHLLFKGDVLAATALDQGFVDDCPLPPLPSELIPFVRPRGLRPAHGMGGARPHHSGAVFELGPTNAADFDSAGRLHFENCVARLAIAAHHHATIVGYSQDFTTRTGIGRMLAELKFSRLGSAEPGYCLRAVTRLVSVAGKSFVTEHRLSTHADELVALFELCTLAVDLKTRKTTDVPDFLKALAT
jgi:acyl-CoA thioesterase FadM